MTSSEDIYLHQFKPRSMLEVKRTAIEKPLFPVIDAHNHLMDPFGGGWDKRDMAPLLDILDQANVKTYIDLDGGWGEKILQSHLEKFKHPHPDRFRVFGGVDWDAWRVQGDKFADWVASRLRQQAGWGADGLKIWKHFGLHVKDHLGNLARVNDARLDPIWQAAAELKLPVVIHVGDPAAFFLPLGAANERWEELHAHPDWQFPSPPFPSFHSIQDDLASLVAKHPRTVFIGAHVAGYSENLAWVSALLDKCPNFYADIAGRIGELGRQPYTAQGFFKRYSDRILFGTDMGPDLAEYRLHYRFLETDDEYFNYNNSDVPLQGRWMIYGLRLPPEVLEKVYFKNAEKVILQRKG